MPGTREIADAERELLDRLAPHIILPEPFDRLAGLVTAVPQLPPAEPLSWSDMAAMVERFLDAAPPQRELHCGIAVWDTLRDLKPEDTGPIGLGAALGGAPLYGVPVQVDRAMSAGRWELREGDQVVRAGDITPEHAGTAFYVPGLGWVAFSLGDQDRTDSAT